MTTPNAGLPVTGDTYMCGCKQPLSLERLVSIERNAMFGRVTITWRCDCTPGEDLRGSYMDYPPLMAVLFGGKAPALPWYSRLRWQADMDIHATDLNQWAWEVDQLASSDELIQWFGWLPPNF